MPNIANILLYGRNFINMFIYISVLTKLQTIVGLQVTVKTFPSELKLFGRRSPGMSRMLEFLWFVA